MEHTNNNKFRLRALFLSVALALPVPAAAMSGGDSPVEGLKQKIKSLDPAQAVLFLDAKALQKEFKIIGPAMDGPTRYKYKRAIWNYIELETGIRLTGDMDNPDNWGAEPIYDMGRNRELIARAFLDRHVSSFSLSVQQNSLKPGGAFPKACIVVPVHVETDRAELVRHMIGAATTDVDALVQLFEPGELSLLFNAHEGWHCMDYAARKGSEKPLQDERVGSPEWHYKIYRDELLGDAGAAAEALLAGHRDAPEKLALLRGLYQEERGEHAAFFEARRQSQAVIWAVAKSLRPQGALERFRAKTPQEQFVFINAIVNDNALSLDAFKAPASQNARIHRERPAF